jgi:hypothetical protein
MPKNYDVSSLNTKILWNSSQGKWINPVLHRIAGMKKGKPAAL